MLPQQKLRAYRRPDESGFKLCIPGKNPLKSRFASRPGGLIPQGDINDRFLTASQDARPKCARRYPEYRKSSDNPLSDNAKKSKVDH
jgi:hypothetical protein